MYRTLAKIRPPFLRPPFSAKTFNTLVSSEFNRESARVQFCPPLLYSVFVDDLLSQLDDCGLGAMVGSVHCHSPMYADDLSLIADSHDNLQSLLDIVSRYASAWRYQINSSKSAVMVFGEPSRSRSAGRQSRSFSVCSESIQECDMQLLPSGHLTPSIGLWLYQDLKPWLRRQERFLRPEFSRCKIWLPTPHHFLQIVFFSQLCSMGQNPSLKLTSPC